MNFAITNILGLIAAMAIIITYIGVTVTLYGLFKKNMSVEDATRYFLSTSGIGLIIMSVIFIMEWFGLYDIRIEIGKSVIPTGYILSILIFGILTYLKEKHREENDNNAKKN